MTISDIYIYMCVCVCVRDNNFYPMINTYLFPGQLHSDPRPGILLHISCLLNACCCFLAVADQQ